MGFWRRLKHIYDYIKSDSNNEIQFAKELESGEILVYAKLPNKFKIPTPIGNYNPDWAIVFTKKDIKYIYFVAETKSTEDETKLRTSESLKIKNAKKHFEALNNKDLMYNVVTSYDTLITKAMK